MPAQTVIQIRRDTGANWITADPVLASGEIGFETDTNQLKVGNGTLAWTALPYASGAGGASVEISETAPADPEEGDVWFNSTDGRAYIYYDNFWVDLNPGIAGPAGKFTVSATAPTDPAIGDGWFNSSTARLFIYYDNFWVEATSNYVGPTGPEGPAGPAGAPAEAPSGNAIINGAFDIWQRGTTFTNPAQVYIADRFVGNGIGGTVVFSQQKFTPNELNLQSGEFQNYIRLASSGQSEASHFTRIQQRIEDVRTFAGQTVTLSFYAKATSGSPKVSVAINQFFGSGGTDGVFEAIDDQTVSTSWARYSFTFTMPSVSGKTIVSGNDFVSIWIYTSAGADLALAGGIGIQNNTFDIFGVQLEAGSTATPFRRNSNSVEGELSACQRYYEKSYNLNVAPGTSSVLGNGFLGNITQTLASGVAGNSSGINYLPFKVTKRAAPTMRVYDFDGTIDAVRVYPPDAKKTGVTGLANIQTSGAFQFMSFSATSTALNSGNNALFSWTADAEL